MLILMATFGAAFVIVWLAHRFVVRRDYAQEINNIFFTLRDETDRLRAMRTEGNIPATWKEAVRRAIESFELVEKEFIGLDLDRTDDARKRIVQGVVDLEREVKALTGRIERSVHDRAEAERKATAMLSAIPERLNALDGRAQSPRTRRMQESARAQYAEARQKIDDGGEIDWVLLYTLLHAADDSSRTVERVIVEDERDVTSKSAEDSFREGADAKLNGGTHHAYDQDTSYRSGDGPAPSASHDSDHSSHSSGDTGSSSGDSGGGGDGGGGGGGSD